MGYRFRPLYIPAEAEQIAGGVLYGQQQFEMAEECGLVQPDDGHPVVRVQAKPLFHEDPLGCVLDMLKRFHENNQEWKHR